MEKAFAEIKMLLRTRAKHRSGFCLADVTPVGAATHAVGEAAELLNAVVFRHARDEQLDEIADVLACCFHMSLMLGYDHKAVEKAVVRKLEMRFTTEAKTDD